MNYLLTGVSLALLLAAGQARAQAMQIPKPTAGLVANAAAGKKLYAAKCAQCHGRDLGGTQQGPALVHGIYAPGHHSDIAFQIAARHGSRQHHWNFDDMPRVAGLTPDDVANITAFVRAEQRKTGIR